MTLNKCTLRETVNYYVANNIHLIISNLNHRENEQSIILKYNLFFDPN